MLIAWWFLQVRGEGWRTAFDPFSTFSIGTVLVQWAIVLAAFWALNRWLARRSGVEEAPGDAAWLEARSTAAADQPPGPPPR